MSSPGTVPAVDEPPASAGHWFAAWDNALRAVELDVDHAESLIARMHAGDEAPDFPPSQDWVAPALLGQVPREFTERARALLQRQLDVTERLAEAMVHARSQRRGLGKFDPGEQPPVFVDQAF